MKNNDKLPYRLYKNIVIAILLIYMLTTLITGYLVKDKLYIISIGDVTPISTHIKVKASKPIKQEISMLTVSSVGFNAFTYLWLEIFNKGYLKIYSNEEILHPSYSLADQNWQDRQERIESYNAAYIAAAKLSGLTPHYIKKFIYTGNSIKNVRFPLQKNDEILTINDHQILNIDDEITELQNKNQQL